MPITIPGKAQNAFEGSMKTSQSVELPFPCPAFFVVNGDAKMRPFNDFRYFGGLSGHTDKIVEASSKWQDAPYPIPGLELLEMMDDAGKPYETLSARSLIVAPIGMRLFSSLKENGFKKRVAPYTKGATPGIQVLSLLAYKNEQKQITPLYPIMLSANGYQVNHIQKAFEDWRKAIKPFVNKLVPGASASVLNLFYMYIGTFGPERKQELVGRGDNQRTITPIVSFIPESLDEKKVENMYVGEEVAEWMADIHEESLEWLKVFSNMQSAQSSQPQAAYVEEYIPEPPPPEDDIPF